MSPLEVIAAVASHVTATQGSIWEGWRMPGPQSLPLSPHPAAWGQSLSPKSTDRVLLVFHEPKLGHTRGIAEKQSGREECVIPITTEPLG